MVREREKKKEAEREREIKTTTTKKQDGNKRTKSASEATRFSFDGPHSKRHKTTGSGIITNNERSAQKQGNKQASKRSIDETRTSKKTDEFHTE